MVHHLVSINTRGHLVPFLLSIEKYSARQLRFYCKSKILNFLKITAIMKTKDISLKSPIKLPLEMKKKLLNFSKFLGF